MTGILLSVPIRHDDMPYRISKLRLKDLDKIDDDRYPWESVVGSSEPEIKLTGRLNRGRIKGMMKKKFDDGPYCD